MIKILYILNDLEDISLNQNALRIASSLPRKSFTAHVLALKKSGSLKNRFFTLFKQRFYISDKPFIYGVFQTAEIIKRHGIGIVHTQTIRADYTLFFAKLLLSLYRITVFHIANRRNYLFLACESSFLIKNILYFLSCHLTNLNVCVANHLQTKLVARLLVPPSKTTIILNGVHLPKYYNRTGRTGKPPLITYTGQLVKRKNVMLLFQALTRVVSPFRCFIIGNGPEKQQFKRYLQRQKLTSKVKLQPFTPDIPKYLALTDIFVLPSLAEGLSMSLLEAMSFGVPSIVSDIDANTELIQHMKEGIITPRFQVSVLASSLDSLLKDSTLRHQLGMNARRKIKEVYEVNRMLRQYHALYSRIIR